MDEMIERMKDIAVKDFNDNFIIKIDKSDLHLDKAIFLFGNLACTFSVMTKGFRNIIYNINYRENYGLFTIEALEAQTSDEDITEYFVTE